MKSIKDKDGDPEKFALGDCSTQRNLSAAGRAQARAIGGQLKAHGIGQAWVFSSQWCRCLETAELLGLGPVEERAELNSFFGFTIVMDKNTLRRKWRRSFQRPSVFFKWILSLFLLGHFKRGHHHG